MTTEGFIGSAPERILDRLTTAMEIEHKLGILEDARTGAPPRITWVPPDKNGIRIVWAPFALPDQDVTSLREMDFDVHFYAASYTQLVEMVDRTSTSLDIYFGPEQGQLPTLALDGVARPGYKFGAASGIGPVQNAAVAGAWACVCPATLREFVSRAQYTTTAPIHTPAPVTVTTTALDGTGEQQAIP